MQWPHAEIPVLVKSNMVVARRQLKQGIACGIQNGRKGSVGSISAFGLLGSYNAQHVALNHRPTVWTVVSICRLAGSYSLKEVKLKCGSGG